MTCIFRHLRSFLGASDDRADAVELVHASGSVVLDGAGHPLRFASELDAMTFAGRFLCEPHTAVPVEVRICAAA